MNNIMKNKTANAFVCIILVLSMILSLFAGVSVDSKTVFAAEDPTSTSTPAGYITISIEAGSIGLGFIEEPQKVPYYEGETVADVTIRFLEETGRDAVGATKEGMYISAVETDWTAEERAEKIVVPNYTLNNDYSQASTTEEYIAMGDSGTNMLCAGDYDESGYTSGWMYTTKNANGFASVGASDYAAVDGDVVRWQFSLEGWGADLGYVMGGYGEPFFSDVADKNDLFALMGEINTSEHKNEIIGTDEYEEAVSIAAIVNSTQDDVDVVYNALDTVYKEVVPIGTISLSIDAGVMGLGFAQEPIQVDLYDGDTAATILMRWFDEKNGNVGTTETLSYGYNIYGTGDFYYTYSNSKYSDNDEIYLQELAVSYFDITELSSADTMREDMPEYMQDIFTEQYINSLFSWSPWTGVCDYDEVSSSDSATYLGNFDYSGSSASWKIITASNKNTNYWGDLADGDVIRIQFTTCAGKDLGYNYSTVVKAYDYDGIVAMIAAINSADDKGQLLSDESDKAVYDNAISYLLDLGKAVNQSDIDNALLQLSETFPTVECSYLDAAGNKVTINSEDYQEEDVVIGSVSMSVEASTLGMDYIVEPVVVDLYKNDTVDEILIRYLEANGIAYTADAGYDGGLYITGIEDGFTSINERNTYVNANIPDYLYDTYFSDVRTSYIDTLLGSYDYDPYAGWMFTIAQAKGTTYTGAGATTPQDGDVIRWQFSWNSGGDFGCGWSENLTEKYDYDGLVAMLAGINGADDKDTLLSVPSAKTAYDNANSYILDLGKAESQGEIDEVFNELVECFSTVEIRYISDIAGTITDLRTPAGYVTLSIEASTVGFGYIEEPTKYPYYEGEDWADVFLRFCADNGRDVYYEGDPDKWMWVKGIEDDFLTVEERDTALNIPDYALYKIDDILDDRNEQYYVEDDLRDYGSSYDTMLTATDYISGSYWAFTLASEKTDLEYSLNEYEVKDGDVLRCQFAITPESLGLYWWTNSTEYIVGKYDRDTLSALIGAINAASNTEEILTIEGVQEAYDNANDAMLNLYSGSEFTTYVDKSGATVDASAWSNNTITAADIEAIEIALAAVVDIEYSTFYWDGTVADYITVGSQEVLPGEAFVTTPLTDEEIAKIAQDRLDAIAEIDAYYNSADYDSYEQAIIALIVTNATETINKSVGDGIEYAVTKAKADIDEIKTTAEKDAETALQEAKETAIANINGYLTDVSTSYRDQEQAEIAEIIENAETSINLAESDEAIDSIENLTKTALDAVVTITELNAQAGNLQDDKDYAADYIAKYRSEADYRSQEWAMIESIIAEYTSLIKSAVYSQDVTSFMTEACEEIDYVKTQAEIEDLNARISTHLQNTLEYQYDTITAPTLGSVAGEWTVLTIARGDYDASEDYYLDYFDRIEQEMVDCYGTLHWVKYTEYSRLILALQSAGFDITDVAGYDLTSYYGSISNITAQGINGPIFALIALDTNDYLIPESAYYAGQADDDKNSRKVMLEWILNQEITVDIDGDGDLDKYGYALTGDEPDPDITAMAIQAFSAYYNGNDLLKAEFGDDVTGYNALIAEIQESVDRCVNILGEMQLADGDYGSWGTTNSESTTQVIVALTSLGIDPLTDTRFIKNGNTLLDGLMKYAVADGGFKHVYAGEVNAMATDQGTYGLIAYDRFINGENSLYDMSDVESVYADIHEDARATAKTALKTQLNNVKNSYSETVWVDVVALRDAEYAKIDALATVADIEAYDVSAAVTLCLDGKATLETVRTTAITAIDALSVVTDSYYDTQLGEIAKLIASAKETINTLRDETSIEAYNENCTAYNALKTAIDNISTKEEIDADSLVKAKADKKSEINSAYAIYNEAKYKAEDENGDWGDITAIFDAAKTAVADATTETEVSAVNVLALIEKANAVKTAAQIDVETALADAEAAKAAALAAALAEAEALEEAAEKAAAEKAAYEAALEASKTATEAAIDSLKDTAADSKTEAEQASTTTALDNIIEKISNVVDTAKDVISSSESKSDEYAAEQEKIDTLNQQAVIVAESKVGAVENNETSVETETSTVVVKTEDNSSITAVLVSSKVSEKAKEAMEAKASEAGGTPVEGGSLTITPVGHSEGESVWIDTGITWESGKTYEIPHWTTDGVEIISGSNIGKSENGTVEFKTTSFSPFMIMSVPVVSTSSNSSSSISVSLDTLAPTIAVDGEIVTVYDANLTSITVDGVEVSFDSNTVEIDLADYGNGTHEVVATDKYGRETTETVTVSSVKEEIEPETPSETETPAVTPAPTTAPTQEPAESAQSLAWLWILLGVVVIGGIAGVVIYKKKKQ